MTKYRYLKPSGFLVAIILFFAMPVAAQKKIQLPKGGLPVSARADQLSYDRENEVLTLTGDVRIERPPWIIYAPELTIELKTNLARADKGVRIVKQESGIEKEIISADQAEINIDAQTGFLVSGKLTLPTSQGQVTIAGERMERLSENKFLFKTGSFTTCQCEPGKIPDWQIRAREIAADTQGSVKVRAAKILVHDKAVFYLPYFEYPVTTKRKSGFLPPEMGYNSRSGMMLGIPYYQLLGPAADLTIYPSWVEKRGPMLGSEFRYNLGKYSVGRGEGFVIDDQKDHAWRWSAGYQGDSTWKSGWLREDIRLISDNEYILDFDQDLASRWERQMESDIAFSQDLPGSNLSAEINWYDDLAGYDLKPIPGWRPDIDKSLVQFLPKINYQVFNKKIAGPLAADMNSSFAYLYRQDQSQGRGAALDFAPRLTFTPYISPGVKIFSAAGYALTGLMPDQAFSEPYLLSRPFAEANLSLAFEKIWDQGSAKKNKYRHMLEPELVVYYLGESQKPEDPFFAALYKPDEIGRVGIRLTSLLFQKALGRKNAASSLVSEFEVNQFYDWVNNEFYDLELRGFFRVPDKYGVNTDIYYDPEDNRLSRGQAQIWVQDQRQDRFWVGFLYAEGEVESYWYNFLQEDAEDWSAGAKVPVYRDLSVAYQIDYSQKYESIVSQSMVLSYTRQKCWQADLVLSERVNPESPGRDPIFSANFYFQLLGISQISTGPEFAGFNMEPLPDVIVD